MSTKTNSSARNYEPCSTVTGPLDAASILLNLTDYHVITATHEPAGRQVLIEPVATEAACPSCGVLTTRIQARPVHRVKDLLAGGDGLQI